MMSFRKRQSICVFHTKTKNKKQKNHKKKKECHEHCIVLMIQNLFALLDTKPTFYCISRRRQHASTFQNSCSYKAISAQIFLYILVATYPSTGGQGEKKKVCLLMMKTCGVATNVYSRKMLEKPKRGLRILKIRVWELFTHGEGISTPHACHKGRQPLIECA